MTDTSQPAIDALLASLTDPYDGGAVLPAAAMIRALVMERDVLERQLRECEQELTWSRTP